MTLEEKTLTLQRVQLVYNGASSERMTTADAISKLNDILAETNPIRPLARQAAALLNAIILGRPDDDERHGINQN